MAREPKVGISFWPRRCNSQPKLYKPRPETSTLCGESGLLHRGPLAQLARALPSHGRGHWFKSSTAHQFPSRFQAFPMTSKQGRTSKQGGIPLNR